MFYKGYFLYYLGSRLKHYTFVDQSFEFVEIMKRLTQLKADRYMGEVVVQYKKNYSIHIEQEIISI